jgi:hypothetical protein
VGGIGQRLRPAHRPKYLLMDKLKAEMAKKPLKKRGLQA